MLKFYKNLVYIVRPPPLLGVRDASEYIALWLLRTRDAQRHCYIDTGHAWKHIFYQLIWLLLPAHPSIWAGAVAQGKNHSFWVWHSYTFTAKLLLSHLSTHLYIHFCTAGYRSNVNGPNSWWQNNNVPMCNSFPMFGSCPNL